MFELNEHELAFINMISGSEEQKQKLIEEKMRLKQEEWKQDNKAMLKHDKAVKKFVNTLKRRK